MLAYAVRLVLIVESCNLPLELLCPGLWLYLLTPLNVAVWFIACKSSVEPLFFRCCSSPFSGTFLLTRLESLPDLVSSFPDFPDFLDVAEQAEHLLPDFRLT